MQYVLFVPSTQPSETSVSNMFNAVISGLKPAVRTLADISTLADNDIPVLSAVYTDDVEARRQMRKIVKSDRPYVVIDHTWFSELRGTHFRVVANGFQPKKLITREPLWQAYIQLPLKPPVPWRKYEEGRVLFLPHSERFGEIFGFSPAHLELWLKFHNPFLKWENVTVRSRHASEARESPETAILNHGVVVGFNTEMLIKALRLGVPAIGHPEGSVVHAFNGLKASDLSQPNRLQGKCLAEVDIFCATLASYYQASLDQLATAGFIENLLETQLAG